MRLIIFCTFVLLALIFVFAGCGTNNVDDQASSDEQSAFHRIVPDGNYKVLVGGNPSAIIRSEYIQQIMETFEVDKEKLEEQAGFPAFQILEKIDKAELLFDTYYLYPPVIFIGGSIGEDDIKLIMRPLREPEEKEYRGRRYWTGGFFILTTFTMAAADGFVSAIEELLERIIDFEEEGGDSLADNEELLGILNLIDTDSDLYMATWGETPFGRAWLVPEPFIVSFLEIEPGEVDEIFEALNDVNAIGASFSFSESIDEMILIRFKERSSAEVVHKFLDKRLPRIFEKVADMAVANLDIRMIEQLGEIGFGIDKIRNMAETIKLTVQDNILEIRTKSIQSAMIIFFPVTYLGIAIPSFADSSDMENQVVATAHVMELGKGVERYIINHPRIGPPRADDVEELIQILHETKIKTISRGRIRDNWYNLIHYSWSGTGPTSWSYTVMSYGSDGAPGPAITPNANGERIVTHFVEDIIWSNGAWYQRPKRTQTSQRFLSDQAAQTTSDRQRQAISVYNVIELGKGVERYKIDHPRIGPPRVDNLEDLQRIFDEAEIGIIPEAIRDGWGNLLHYSRSGTTPRTWTYTVMSYGSDGAPGPAVKPNANGEMIVTRFEEDIIWVDGRLIQRPEG